MHRERPPKRVASVRGSVPHTDTNSGALRRAASRWSSRTRTPRPCTVCLAGGVGCAHHIALLGTTQACSEGRDGGEGGLKLDPPPPTRRPTPVPQGPTHPPTQRPLWTLAPLRNALTHIDVCNRRHCSAAHTQRAAGLGATHQQGPCRGMGFLADHLRSSTSTAKPPVGTCGLGLARYQPRGPVAKSARGRVGRTEKNEH